MAKEKKTYNTNPDFEPTKLNDVSLDFIINYCQAKGKKEVDWLKAAVAVSVAPDKKGKERKISFIELRKEFTKRYFPKIAPQATEKRVSMYDRIKDL